LKHSFAAAIAIIGEMQSEVTTYLPHQKMSPLYFIKCKLLLSPAALLHLIKNFLTKADGS